jgi:hypothetical protein
MGPDAENLAERSRGVKKTKRTDAHPLDDGGAY